MSCRVAQIPSFFCFLWCGHRLSMARLWRLVIGRVGSVFRSEAEGRMTSCNVVRERVTVCAVLVFLVQGGHLSGFSPHHGSLTEFDH